MTLASLEPIVGALSSESVRYLVAGGLAVNAHGYIRHTQDVDLVIALDTDNILRAFRTLATLGYKPLVPITAEQFTNAELRGQWIRAGNHDRGPRAGRNRVESLSRRRRLRRCAASRCEPCVQ